MLDQSSAILAGFVASVVITPLVVAMWKKVDPPQLFEPMELDSDVLRSCKAIEREAIFATFAFLFVLGVSYGWGTTLGLALGIIFFSALFAIPYLWTMARCILLGPQRTKEYFYYYQSKHGVGLKLASRVGIVSTYVLVVSLVAYQFGFR